MSVEATNDVEKLRQSAVHQLIVTNCTAVEFETDVLVSRQGARLVRGIMTRPTNDEYGQRALVMWGMMQLAKAIEDSGETIDDWLNR